MSASTSTAGTPAGITTRAMAVAISLGGPDNPAAGAAAAPTFAGTGSNTVTLTDLRMQATITELGPPAASSATVQVWGMQQSLMQQLSSLGTRAPYYTLNNSVTVSAGPSGGPLSVVFTGTISDCYADFGGAPDVVFNINGLSGSYEKVRPVPATSMTGSVDVAQLMAGFATQMGFGFENNGVQGVKLPGAYYAGSALDQAYEAAADAGIIMAVVPGPVLAIWPGNGYRSGVVPLISAATGMVGYPAFAGSAGQIALRTLFNPSVRFGGLVQVQSTISPQATGTWFVSSLSHSLSALMPDGDWFTDITAIPPGQLP